MESPAFQALKGESAANVGQSTLSRMANPSPSEVLAQVEAICKSEPLVRSTRGGQLLRYLTRAVAEGAPSHEIKESVIGVEIFKRLGGYDAKKDSIVRVSIGDLRARLDRYYETGGRYDPVRIQIPLGSYAPRIYYEPGIAASKLSDTAAMHVANAKAALDKRTLPGHETAFRYLELALTEHPNHPRILSLKAMVHAARAMYGRYARTELEAAEALVEEGKKQEHEPWERFLIEAWIRATLHFDWAGAEILFNRAIELSHGEAKYNSWHTAFLASQLRTEEALIIQSEAVTHFAHDIAATRCDLAQLQIVTGRFEEAEELLRSTIELFPHGHYMPYLHLALLHEARGDFAEAVKANEQVPVTAPESTITVGMRVLMTGLAGNRDSAKSLYDQLRAEKQTGQHVPASQLATAAIGAGDHDGAVAWFVEAAVTERDPIMNWVAIYPFERHIRHHPGFRALVMETMKLKFLSEKRFAAATAG